MQLLLWHCWLGVRKSIRCVKIDWWGVVVVICLEQGASSLVSFDSWLVLPFWYRLIQVVLSKRPLNGCSSCSISLHCSLWLWPVMQFTLDEYKPGRTPFSWYYYYAGENLSVVDGPYWTADECTWNIDEMSLHFIKRTLDTIRYDTIRDYFNERSKADISQLNLPHGTDN